MSEIDIDAERSRELLRRMLLARRFDERVLALRTSGELEGVVHPAFGQEGVAVGVCAVLRADDKITSTHRGHAHCIAKGADIRRMMSELFGRANGYCGGKGGSMHIADFELGILGANGIVAAGLPIAAGAALAASLTSHDSVTVAFFSDGALGAGPFHEVLNIAALWKLPLVLLCENNGWAAGTSIDAACAAEHPDEFASAYGVEHAHVDGNDLDAVMAAASTAVEHARRGAGPYLLETQTFRMGNHAIRGAEMPELRSVDVLGEWAARDPIDLYADVLRRRGAIDDDWRRRAEHEIDLLLEDAVEFARSSPFPDVAAALEGVFA